MSERAGGRLTYAHLEFGVALPAEPRRERAASSGDVVGLDGKCTTDENQDSRRPGPCSGRGSLQGGSMPSRCAEPEPWRTVHGSCGKKRGARRGTKGGPSPTMNSPHTSRTDLAVGAAGLATEREAAGQIVRDTRVREVHVSQHAAVGVGGAWSTRHPTTADGWADGGGSSATQ